MSKASFLHSWDAWIYNKYRDKGREENIQEDYPTMEHSQRKRQEGYYHMYSVLVFII